MEESNGLVPIGQLDTYNNFDPNGYFGSIYDAESAKRAVGKVKVLEEYLKAADQYGEYAAKFCLLEAQMYIQIAQVEGSEDKLTEAKRRLVMWIRSKTDEEIAEILEEVGTGIRISKIERRERSEQFNNMKKHASNREYQRISDEIVAQLDRDGCTKLSPFAFIEKWHSIGEPDSKTIKAYTEKTRDQLIKKGGRGLGDGKGTYMKPEKCDRKQVALIIKTRLESIVSDLKAIKQICDETHFVIPNEGISMITKLIRSLGAVPDDTIALDVTDGC